MAEELPFIPKYDSDYYRDNSIKNMSSDKIKSEIDVTKKILKRTPNNKRAKSYLSKLKKANGNSGK